MMATSYWLELLLALAQISKFHTVQCARIEPNTSCAQRMVHDKQIKFETCLCTAYCTLRHTVPVQVQNSPSPAKQNVHTGSILCHTHLSPILFPDIASPALALSRGELVRVLFATILLPGSKADIGTSYLLVLLRFQLLLSFIRPTN